MLELEDVKQKFLNLINGVETREDIARFADLAMHASDLDDLSTRPEEFDKIWRSLIYLSGVDTQIERGLYLHSNLDFIKEMESLDF